MLGVVSVEPPGLEVEFVRFLEVTFELWPGLVGIRKPNPFEDGGWEESHELDGGQCLVQHLIGHVGRWLRDGLHIAILKAIEEVFDRFVGVSTSRPATLHSCLLRGCHTTIIGS